MSSLRHEVLSRAVEVHGATAQRPWVNLPDHVTLRHPVNNKWFGLVMDVPRSKVGLEGEGTVDVLDVKVGAEQAAALLGEPGFAHACHMNKRTWIAVLLDGAVSRERVVELLDASFDATTPKPHTTPEAVHKSMQGNKSANTKPELLVRQMLREMGQTGYRLQWKKCPGKPDIAFPGRKMAIFVNGCFWHRCPKCNLPTPKSNVEFWEAKFKRNVERDKKNLALATEQGWKVLNIWECDLKKGNLEATRQTVYEFVTLDGGDADED